MIKWVACELHTHTVHSDGSATLLQLAQSAKELGLECIALTDHNTISGHLEIPSVADETALEIVYGMEWTTFYGHMVAMGIKTYVDWRDKGQSDIHKGIAQIHNAGGLAGVAHPYRLGSPMCTGCYWQFNINDWNEVDYLEVWSEPFPSINPVNHRALKLWTDILNKDIKLTGVSGRDWHGSDNGNQPIAVTYLGLSTENGKDISCDVKNALSRGHAVVTMGPLVIMTAETDRLHKKYIIGETLPLDGDSRIAFNISIDFTVRQGLWKIDSDPMNIVLMSNTGKLVSMAVENGEGIKELLYTSSREGLKWVRAELHGKIQGNPCMIAFTNPIYI